MGNGMRALKIATIVMGVLILLGTAVMIAAIIKRGGMTSPPPPVASSLAPSGALPGSLSGPPGNPFTTLLDEPPGTTILGIAQVRDWLAVTVRGGGPDRVVLIDPVSGAVTGRVALAR